MSCEDRTDSETVLVEGPLIPKAKGGVTIRTELLRFDGAVERDPAIDAWVKEHAVLGWC
jgi:hypothetical protein